MTTSEKPRAVRSHDIILDNDYVEWIHDIKLRFQSSQQKAAVKVNYEQLFFNWQLGRDIVTRKAEQKWGSGIVEQLSLDLQAAFPDAKGFSTTNLWYMKKWFLFYSTELQKLHQLGGELDFPVIFSFVPWRHHIEIITKCKDVDEAIFYIQRTIEDGLSRNALDDIIRADLYHTKGAALTNFGDKLPAIQGQLAQEILKGNYDLGFVSLPKGYDEDALEDVLEQHMTRFLLELGDGWAFIGRQKEIIIAGKTRKIDLLFYHIYLRCYVVLELKVKPFDPEFAGKLNFYVNAVNEFVKRDSDNPTIGLLICKDMDRTEVQLAFQGITTPMGVATYDNVQIKKIQEQLPTAEQFQKQIELAEKEYKMSLHNED